MKVVGSESDMAAKAAEPAGMLRVGAAGAVEVADAEAEADAAPGPARAPALAKGLTADGRTIVERHTGQSYLPLSSHDRMHSAWKTCRHCGSS